MVKTVSRVLNVTMIGPEPEFSGEMIDRVTLMRSFNWYSYSHTLIDSKKWILEWMRITGRTEKQITIYRSSNHSSITQTKASIARMLSRGLDDMELKQYLDEHINRVLEVMAPKPVSETSTAWRPSGATDIRSRKYSVWLLGVRVATTSLDALRI